MANNGKPSAATASPESHRLSDADVLRLFEKARQQYDEHLRTHLFDIKKIAEANRKLAEKQRPKHDWNKPIGLEVTEPIDDWFR